MPANIFPKKEFIDEIPYAESVVYDLLSGLSENFTVFYSVRWIKRGSKWKSTWKENDFVILNPKLGGLVLEVKGGDIHCDGNIFVQINTQTGETNELSPEKKKDPLSQAIDGIYHYRGYLSDISSDLEDRFPIEAAVFMPGTDVNSKIDTFPMSYREIKEAVLGESALKKGAQSIYDVFDAYKNRKKTNVSEDEYRRILAAFASDFDLVETKSFKSDEMSDAFMRFTNEQSGLLDYISEQKMATIQGAAGTGKTIIAKTAAHNFSKEGRKVLFLCFNSCLMLDLKKNYPYENVTYLNIHSFINYYGNTSKNDLSKPSDRANELYEIDYDDLDFDDVIIDEAQDLLNEEIEYFSEYIKIKDGHYFVFYDKNQMVSFNPESDIADEKDYRWIDSSECKLLLTRNCRNTKEIALTSYNILDIELPNDKKMVNGVVPTISFVKGEPLMKLGKLIKIFTGDEQGFKLKDITILSLKSEKNSILNGIKKFGGVQISRERNESLPFFTTASKFKGLESKVVIIVDIDETCFSDRRMKNDFYVACSRATQRLALFINGDEGTIKGIGDAINKKQFVPQKKIIMKTKTELLEL